MTSFEECPDRGFPLLLILRTLCLCHVIVIVVAHHEIFAELPAPTYKE